ncbi:hemolysin III family protein [Gordonia sp. X0973]|uniref:PAQR family membrane homeostasis protein TrhA n=1 Tax=Gordonia sp. X0973 TaxID=2742602 RepID=UPI000F546AA7|nr:hemolysin III family protein [Gordonia sp. X0973]QKT06626.1 hemolysin III family protein [Gordonia sp. X0973]
MTSPIPTPIHLESKPRLRGVIHQYSAWISTLAVAAIVIGAAQLKGVGAAVACAVYGITVFGLFTISATYHRHKWGSERAAMLMKRADHSMIFLFIAGSYTPFCYLALPSPTRWWVLGIVWSGALAGMILKIAWPQAPRWLGVVLYIGLGWVIIAKAATLIHYSGWLVISLLVIGGVLYSVGGILYALRWPDPWPETFGHHEFFHACTVVAAIAHYTAIWLLLLR